MVSADGVDGLIIGEASKSHLVVYKQTEQKLIAMKKNSNTSQFQKKNETLTTITFCEKLMKRLLLRTIFFVSLLARDGNLVSFTMR